MNDSIRMKKKGKEHVKHGFSPELHDFFLFFLKITLHTVTTPA